MGSYSPNHKPRELRLLGCFGFKSDRCGFLEERQVIGRESPAFPTKNYNQIDSKQKYPKFVKPNPEKKVEKVNLSPASYNNNDSFKKAILPRERFYINRGKVDNFISVATKNNNWVPGAGKYDHDKGLHYITKGAAKGWK